MEDNYTGDMILIDRLSEFYPVNSWSWNEGEVVELDELHKQCHQVLQPRLHSMTNY